MLTRVRFAVAFAVVAVGCAEYSDTRTFIEVDSAGVVVAKNDLRAAVGVCSVAAEPSIRIGASEGGPEHELHRVFGASRLSDGSIALVNQGSQQLRVYDRSGRYVRSAGRQGRGPGEFAAAFHLWVLPGDTVWVGDYRPWQFLVFGPDGAWLRTVRPEPPLPNPPAVMEVFADGRVLLAERPIGPDGGNWSRQTLTLVLYSPDGAVLDTVATVPDSRWGMLPNSQFGLVPLFESSARVDASGATLAIGHGSSPELRIYELADSLSLRRIMQWSTGNRTISTEEIAVERARIEGQYANLDPGLRREFVAPQISDDRPVAEQFPAFTGLRVARDGGIWVREFVRPSERARQPWLRFDSSGRYVCRAELPDAVEVLEFGADYVLVKEAGELDVEMVNLYELTFESEDAESEA